MDFSNSFSTFFKLKFFFNSKQSSSSLQFPPYGTNEVGRSGFIGRRELGHGGSFVLQFIQAIGVSIVLLLSTSIHIFLNCIKLFKTFFNLK